jgi:hypothetical protein
MSLVRAMTQFRRIHPEFAQERVVSGRCKFVSLEFIDFAWTYFGLQRLHIVRADAPNGKICSICKVWFHEAVITESNLIIDWTANQFYKNPFPHVSKLGTKRCFFTSNSKIVKTTDYHHLTPQHRQNQKVVIDHLRQDLATAVDVHLIHDFKRSLTQASGTVVDYQIQQGLVSRLIKEQDRVKHVDAFDCGLNPANSTEYHMVHLFGWAGHPNNC